MTQISQTSPNAVGAAANAADLAEATTSGSNPSGSAEPTRASINGADPLARFTAMYGLHADVTRLAGREHGRGNGGGAVAQRDVAPNHAKVCQVASHPLGSGVDTKSTPAPAYDVAHTTREQIEKLKTLPVSEKELTRLKHKDVSDAQLESLKKSKNPDKRQLAETIVTERQKALDIEGQVRLGFTIENAQLSYGDLINEHWRICATTSAANGGQPVLTIVGPDFKPAKDVVVRTHYHGDNATVADPVGSKAGTTSRIRAIIEKHPDTVIVLPEAANSTPKVDSLENDNSYSVDWTHVKSQLQTTADALQAAGITRQLQDACLDKPVRQTVSFHSGGGKVVEVLMKADKSGSLLRADDLELYDSLYGKWQDAVAKWGDTANGRAVNDVLYFHGTNDDWRSTVIKEKFGAKYWPVEMSDQTQFKKMTKEEHEKLNPTVYDGNHKTRPRDYKERDDRTGGVVTRHDVTRTFHENAHYRTMGEFFGAGIDLRGI